MEELAEATRPGFFKKLLGGFRSDDEEFEDFEPVADNKPRHLKLVSTHTYHITVRRQVVTFADAVSSADGLKRGEQQIINLCSADSALREKIKDFLSGVNYSQEGTWEELGEHIYLLAPSTAYVESAPATPRITAAHN